MLQIISQSQSHQKPALDTCLSRAWRDCIKKIYEVDPLCCPKCNGEMRIISFITDEITIKEILSHLGLWSQKPSRDPPKENSSSKINELVYEPIDDSWPEYEEPYIVAD